jgi:hypothetical protein
LSPPPLVASPIVHYPPITRVLLSWLHPEGG